VNPSGTVRAGAAFLQSVIAAFPSRLHTVLTEQHPAARARGDPRRGHGCLIEAETGNHLWAERYDREFADVS
jgi:hypothetical protein